MRLNGGEHLLAGDRADEGVHAAMEPAVERREHLRSPRA
jgi:hypothetical protein